MARQDYASQQAKINKEIEKLQKQAQALQDKSRKPVLASLVRTMKEYDITPDELAAVYSKTKATGKTARPAKATKPQGVKKPVAPKYRHPSSGATWTGRGKAPLWVVEAEKNGQPRQQFLI